jgi:hypothetical protein
MPRPSSPVVRWAVIVAAATLPACISVQRSETQASIAAQSRESAGYALPCEGARVVELRNDSDFAVDVYAYPVETYNRVYLRTLTRGSVETIPLGDDLLRVVTEPSRQTGAPTGARSRVRTRYHCREG